MTSLATKFRARRVASRRPEKARGQSAEAQPELFHRGRVVTFASLLAYKAAEKQAADSLHSARSKTTPSRSVEKFVGIGENC